LLFELDTVTVHLPSYSPGVHRITESVTPDDLDLDPELFSAPLNLSLVLDRHDSYLQFVFNVETEVRLECDLCLTHYVHTLDVHSPMLYVLGHVPGGGEVDDPEISYVPPQTVELDISKDLRDFVILSMPERHLCKEDCRGLCPNCGVDLNTETCRCAES
jgi:uncharacterized protein